MLTTPLTDADVYVFIEEVIITQNAMKFCTPLHNVCVCGGGKTSYDQGETSWGEPTSFGAQTAAVK